MEEKRYICKLVCGGRSLKGSKLGVDEKIILK
jgi:hypothetical protein